MSWMMWILTPLSPPSWMIADLRTRHCSIDYCMGRFQIFHTLSFMLHSMCTLSIVYYSAFACVRVYLLEGPHVLV